MLCAVHIDVGDREDGLCFIAQVLHRGAASRVCSELASENSLALLLVKSPRVVSQVGVRTYVV